MIFWTSWYWVLLVLLGNKFYMKSEVSEVSIFDARDFADLDWYDWLSFYGKYASFGSNFSFFWICGIFNGLLGERQKVIRLDLLDCQIIYRSRFLTEFWILCRRNALRITIFQISPFSFAPPDAPQKLFIVDLAPILKFSLDRYVNIMKLKNSAECGPIHKTSLFVIDLLHHFPDLHFLFIWLKLQFQDIFHLFYSSYTAFWSKFIWFVWKLTCFYFARQ